MSSSVTLDLTATTVNLKLNTDGLHSPILWYLQSNPITGAVEVVPMAGYTARFTAYSDAALTAPVWTKTTANGQLTIVTVASKLFLIDGVQATLANPYGVLVNITDADAALVGEGLFYQLFLTNNLGSEIPMFAKGKITVKRFS